MIRKPTDKPISGTENHNANSAGSFIDRSGPVPVYRRLSPTEPPSAETAEALRGVYFTVIGGKWRAIDKIGYGIGDTIHEAAENLLALPHTVDPNPDVTILNVTTAHIVDQGGIDHPMPHIAYTAQWSPRACMFEAIEFFWNECDKYFASVILKEGRQSLVKHMADFFEMYADTAGKDFDMPWLTDDLVTELEKRAGDRRMED